MFTKFFKGFFFHKVTININTYLDLLQLYAEPQTENLKLHFLLQQNRALLSLRFTGMGVTAGEICSKMDWQRRLTSLAALFSGHNTTGLLHVGLC
jgi:hypothetical protein